MSKRESWKGTKRKAERKRERACVRERDEKRVEIETVEG